MFVNVKVKENEKRKKAGGRLEEKEGEDLGEEDAGDHGDGIDGGESERGGHVAGGELVEEAEGGRIGHGAGQEAGGL